MRSAKATALISAALVAAASAPRPVAAAASAEQQVSERLGQWAAAWSASSPVPSGLAVPPQGPLRPASSPGGGRNRADAAGRAGDQADLAVQVVHAKFP